MDKKVFELMEWRNKHYEHVRYVSGTDRQARHAQERLNEGYTGPRFVFREVKEGSQS